jgi:putative protease
MYGGRAGRDYVTRTQPDNRGIELGVVVGQERGELLVEVSSPIREGDGLGFEAPDSLGGPTMGFTVAAVRTVAARNIVKQAIEARVRVPAGWRVIRTSEAALLAQARASFSSMTREVRTKRSRLDVRLFGAHGTPLKAVFTSNGESVTVRSEATLAPATKRPLDAALLRDQLGRLGETPFSLGAVDTQGLETGVFLPVSELNRLRQHAVDELEQRRGWTHDAGIHERTTRIESAVAAISVSESTREHTSLPNTARLTAQVYQIEDADRAAAAGATEICFDPFLRHPAPPLARVRALGDRLAGAGVALRLRTPTIVRPEDRRSIEKWLDSGLPLLSGHLGLVSEWGRAGRDVVADYATNVFNAHSAVEVFRLGARRIVASVELTVEELAQLVAPWKGRGFDVFLYGRPEGMTIEHCVLSAAFDREPTTCRDLCVVKHANVELTDPTGYTFPVATDSACRNRLLHSRPVDGSEFLPELWRAGVRGYQLVFNVPGEDVGGIVARYRAMIDALSAGTEPDTAEIRRLLGTSFTRGHFARAV